MCRSLTLHKPVEELISGVPIMILKLTLMSTSLIAMCAMAPQAPGGNGSVLKSFPGASGPGYKTCPDTTGAVGPDHVVDFECASFVVHERATGKVALQMSMIDFWAKQVEPANTLSLVTPNDPRMLYDTTSGRFFATCADDKTQHRLYLAVSDSSDPTKGWKGVRTPFQSSDFGFRMGVDKNGWYGAWWNSTDRSVKNTHTGMDGCAVPKADVLAAGGPDLSRATMLRNLELESFPATDLNPDKKLTDPEVFLCKQFPPDTRDGVISRLCLYKVTWSSPSTASLSDVQLIPLGRSYWGPNGASGNNQAPQPAPGLPIRADEGRRTVAVFAHGGRVLGCNGAKDTLTSNPGILWYDVRISDGALLQEGFVDDPVACYTHPSLAVDGDGNIGLGCTRMSASEFPSVYVMMHAASDPPGKLRSPLLAVSGTTYLRNSKAKGALPWGNYSATCVDPSDPKLLWTYQEYANSENDGQWGTAWACFRLTP